MFRYIYFILLIIPLINAVSVQYLDCGTTHSSIRYVYIDECLTPTDCTFNVNANINVTFGFQTNINVAYVRSEVFFDMYEVDTPAVVTPSKGCDAITSGSCPIQASLNYEYSTLVTVPHLSGIANLEFYLKNDNLLADVACFTIFNVKINEPNPTTIEDYAKFYNRKYKSISHKIL